MSAMKQLANEDKLRINVLLAQSPHVVRINESSMALQALTERGEAQITLNPTVNIDLYLRWVRELLAVKATGSPAGYPVFMKRWTRSGELSKNLEKLLLLGEPEAIVAVSHAPVITLAIAQYAWWANASTEVAMGLLQHEVVVASELGNRLAQHLMEFMPFEERAVVRMHMVRLCLQAALLSQQQREQLWRKARRQNPYYVGFAFADSALIPLDSEAHLDFQIIADCLSDELAADNIWANMLRYLLSADGQCWLQIVKGCLQKPADPDVVVALFNAIDQRFVLPKPRRGVENFSVAQQRAEDWLSQDHHDANVEVDRVKTVLSPQHLPLFKAMLVLSQLGENSLNPVFGRSDAFGSVMRKRLRPLTDIIEEQIAILLKGKPS